MYVIWIQTVIHKFRSYVHSFVRSCYSHWLLFISIVGHTHILTPFLKFKLFVSPSCTRITYIHTYTQQVWWVLGQYSDACDLLWVQFSPLLLIKEYFTFPLLSWSLLRQWNVKNEDGDRSQNAIAGHVLGISVNIYIRSYHSGKATFLPLYLRRRILCTFAQCHIQKFQSRNRNTCTFHV